MKTYELTYIISPEITSEEAEAKGKEIETLVTGKEGTILKQSNPSAKALSYPIKKHASGFMGVLEFQTEPEKLVEIKETLSKDGKIVRHMVIIKEVDKPRRERKSQRIIQPKPAAIVETEPKEEVEKPVSKSKKDIKEKVELKDIEQELDEILS